MTSDAGAAATSGLPRLSQGEFIEALRALRSGGDSTALLKGMLSKVSLKPEQAAIVELLLDSDPADADDIAAAGAIEDDGTFDHDLDDDDRAMRGADDEELDALREMNDTLAAALGACPLCWGGEPACACRGRGRAGARPPDPELFDELVMPAVRRVHALRRGMGRRRPWQGSD